MKDKNMNKTYSAGENIEAWCPICNLKSGHTIIAIVNNSPKRIKCNTCDEHHNLIVKPSVKRRTKLKSSARKSRAKEATYQDYLSRLAGGDTANCRKYNIKGNSIMRIIFAGILIIRLISLIMNVITKINTPTINI